MQLFEDRVRGGGPLAGLAVRVVGGDEVIDTLDELLDAGERAWLDTDRHSRTRRWRGGCRRGRGARHGGAREGCEGTNAGALARAATTPTMPCTGCAAPRWPRASPPRPPSLCCTATTAHAQGHHGAGHARLGGRETLVLAVPPSATTTPMRNRCSARLNTGPSSQHPALPAWTRPGHGRVLPREATGAPRLPSH